MGKTIDVKISMVILFVGWIVLALSLLFPPWDSPLETVYDQGRGKYQKTPFFDYHFICSFSPNLQTDPLEIDLDRLGVQCLAIVVIFGGAAWMAKKSWTLDT